MQESGLCPAMAMPTQSVGSRWNQIAHFTFLIVSRKEMRLLMKTSPFFFVFNSLPAMYLMFFFFLLCFFFFFFAGAGCSEGMQVP
jgi:hypothetical protein